MSTYFKGIKKTRDRKALKKRDRKDHVMVIFRK